MMQQHTLLLDLAWRTVLSGNPAPEQAELRRCISTAYYAVFQFVIIECNEAVLASNPLSVQFQAAFSRLFQHKKIREALAEFAKPYDKMTKPFMFWAGGPVPYGFRSLSSDFAQLQQNRFDADYDWFRLFSITQVEAELNRAVQFITEWQTLKSTYPEAVYRFCWALFMHLEHKELYR